MDSDGLVTWQNFGKEINMKIEAFYELCLQRKEG
jgi:hypothetical protein